MDESGNPIEKQSWKKRLAILFAFLFALLWSLDSFFFWTLSALSVYFWLLARLESPGSLNFFNRPSEPIRPVPIYPQDSPYAPPPPPAPPGLETFQKVIKVIRYVFIGASAVLFMLFLIGVFVAKDDAGSEETGSKVSVDPPDDATRFNDLGNAALDRNDYDSALVYYNMALKSDPANQFALYNKGLMYSRKNDFRRSNTLARACLRIHPNYDPAWWLLGYNYDQMNNSDSALYCLKQADEHGYDVPDFYDLVAEVYQKRGQRTLAVEFYKKELDQDTTRVTVYDKLISLDPSNAESYRKKASALR